MPKLTLLLQNLHQIRMRRDVDIVPLVVPMKRSFSSNFESHERLLVVGDVAGRLPRPQSLLLLFICGIELGRRRFWLFDLNSPLRSVPTEVHFPAGNSRSATRCTRDNQPFIVHIFWQKKKSTILVLAFKFLFYMIPSI